MAKHKLSVICADPRSVSRVTEYLLKRDRTAYINVQRAGSTGSFVVRYQGTYALPADGQITAKDLLLAFGETGYSEHYLVVQTSTKCELKRLLVSNDAVLSAKDVERLAENVCADYRGESNGELAYLIDGVEINPQIIRVGSDGRIH